jgi:hypothetical protein
MERFLKKGSLWYAINVGNAGGLDADGPMEFDYLVTRVSSDIFPWCAIYEPGKKPVTGRDTTIGSFHRTEAQARAVAASGVNGRCIGVYPTFPPQEHALAVGILDKTVEDRTAAYTRLYDYSRNFEWAPEVGRSIDRRTRLVCHEDGAEPIGPPVNRELRYVSAEMKGEYADPSEAVRQAAKLGKWIVYDRQDRAVVASSDQIIHRLRRPRRDAT